MRRDKRREEEGRKEEDKSGAVGERRRVRMTGAERVHIATYQLTPLQYLEKSVYNNK